MKQNQKSNQKFNPKLLFLGTFLGTVLVLISIIGCAGCITTTNDQLITTYQLQPHYAMITGLDGYESFDVTFDLNNDNLTVILGDDERVYTLLSHYERANKYISGNIYDYYIDDVFYNTEDPLTYEIEILENSRIKFKLEDDYVILTAI